jgi:hypothetical protein
MEQPEPQDKAPKRPVPSRAELRRELQRTLADAETEAEAESADSGD